MNEKRGTGSRQRFATVDSEKDDLPAPWSSWVAKKNFSWMLGSAEDLAQLSEVGTFALPLHLASHPSVRESLGHIEKHWPDLRLRYTGVWLSNGRCVVEVTVSAVADAIVDAVDAEDAVGAKDDEDRSVLLRETGRTTSGAKDDEDRSEGSVLWETGRTTRKVLEKNAQAIGFLADRLRHPGIVDSSLRVKTATGAHLAEIIAWGERQSKMKEKACMPNLYADSWPRLARAKPIMFHLAADWF
jgi:hypothetical protein